MNSICNKNRNIDSQEPCSKILSNRPDQPSWNIIFFDTSIIMNAVLAVGPRCRHFAGAVTALALESGLNTITQPKSGRFLLFWTCACACQIGYQ